jgi:hypothetical protein
MRRERYNYGDRQAKAKAAVANAIPAIPAKAAFYRRERLYRPRSSCRCRTISL